MYKIYFFITFNLLLLVSFFNLIINKQTQFLYEIGFVILQLFNLWSYKVRHTPGFHFNRSRIIINNLLWHSVNYCVEESGKLMCPKSLLINFFINVTILC